ncbi:hypothetical protein HN51_058818, partial [Arachis hypogaea]
RGRRRWRSSASIICSESIAETSRGRWRPATRWNLSSQTVNLSGDASPPPAERLGAPVGYGQRSGSRLVDAAVPPYRSENLFVATNLKLDSYSPYSLSDV